MERTSNISHGDMEALQKGWGWFLALGIGLILLGVLAIGAPFFATLAVAVLLGWLLVVGGVFELFHAFRSRGRRALLQLLSGILYIGVGVLMLAYPLGGALTLTVLLAAFFVVEGIFRILLALQLRPAAKWGWLLFNGIVSLALGYIIWANLPGATAWVIGLIFGIDMLVGGWSMIMVALAARSPSFKGAWQCVGDECYNP